jgi:endonuclease/exonuclease/phosphatase family metal-dependent hydrolase
MRLLAWNLCRGKLSRKIGAVQEVGFDIAVLPEVAQPQEQSAHCCWVGRSPRQGLAVVTSQDYRLQELPRDPTVPDYIIPFRVEGKRTFTLLAIWTLHDPTFRYIRAVSIALDAYTELFSEGPVVMLGDFNASKIWDSHHPATMNFSAVANELSRRNLVSAYHHFTSEDFGAESRPTFYLHRNSEKPYHIDYCFLPRPWASSIASVSVPGFDRWSDVSDHRPLTVDVADV